MLLAPLIAFQVRSEIIEFHSPVFFKLAWWCPLIYAVIFVTMAFLFPFLEEILTATFTFKRRTIVFEFMAIVFAFIGPIFTQRYPYLIVFILAIYVIFRLGFIYAKWDWFFFLIGALLGTSVEALLIGIDLYHYNDPGFVGIPYWLPLSWGIVTMSGRRIADVIESLSAE